MDLVTDDDTIIRLAHQSEILAAFPLFKPASRLKPNCSRCTKNRAAAMLNQTKAQIAALTPERQQQFKALAAADSVRVIWQEKKQVRELIF